MTDQNMDILQIVVGRGLPEKQIGAGDTLFLKGDTAGAMYVVQTGMIEVLMYGRVLERLGPGGIVGEMALIDGNARCAAALTGTDSRLVAIDKKAFYELVRSEPRFALAVIKVLAARLRSLRGATASDLK